MRRALFAGSFDPIHQGHIDIAERAAAAFDELYFAVYAVPKKNLMFTLEERLTLAKKALAHVSNIQVVSYTGMTVNYARQIDASVMIRGLRTVADFEYEYQMTTLNKRQDPGIETFFLITNPLYNGFSSSGIKEIISLGGNIEGMVTSEVESALREKFEMN